MLAVVLAVSLAPLSCPFHHAVRVHPRAAPAAGFSTLVRPDRNEEERAFDRLVEWVVGAGGFVGHVTVDTVDGLRGLYVLEDVSAGEPLLAVPRSCMLLATEGDAVRGGLKLHEHLMLQLLEAEAGGEKALYRATLPQSVPLLRDWSATELKELQSDALCAQVALQRVHLTRTCERVAAEWARRHPTRTPPTLAALEWAESIVRSRSLASTESEERAMLLVPLFDLCNHAPDHLCAPGNLDCDSTADRDALEVRSDESVPPVMITSDGMVVLCARRALRAGEQVHIEYSKEGNWGLLRDYGFAVLPPDGFLTSAGSEEELHVGGPHELVLGSAQLDYSAVQHVRTQLRASAGMHDVFASESVPTNFRRREEMLLSVAIREACDEALRRMPTSEAHDQLQLVRAEQFSGLRQVGALRFRLGQKRRLRCICTELARVEQILRDNEGEWHAGDTADGGVEDLVLGALMRARGAGSRP